VTNFSLPILGNIQAPRRHLDAQHQERTFPSGWNGFIRVNVLRQSCLRHPGGELHCAQHQDHASRYISPSDRRFAISSRFVGLQFRTNTLVLCQLCPYGGMGSLGTRLHRDCNAMRDTAKISPHVPSTLNVGSVGR